MAGVLSFVAAGLGAAVVPAIALPGDGSLVAIPFSGPTMSRTVALAQRGDRALARPARALADQLVGPAGGARQRHGAQAAPPQCRPRTRDASHRAAHEARGLGFVHGRPLALRSLRDPGPRRPQGSRRPAPCAGRPARLGLGVGAGGRGDAAQHGQGHRRRPVARARRPRLRGDGGPPAGERHPGRPRHHPPGRAGPGQDAGHPLPGRPARRVDADRRRLRDQRRPLPPGLALRPRPGRRARRGHARRLGAPLAALRREAGHARHLHRRPHRRGRPDQDRRGPLPERRAGAALRPHPAGQPRHLRHQRAARPLRADPGRAAQHPRGARRPDPRPPHPAAARRHARGHGQPRGLHEPRPHHHAAQGPLRRADPHALPLRDHDRGQDHGGRGRPADGGRARSACRRS